MRTAPSSTAATPIGAVDNVAPTIAISGAANVDEGSAYSLTLGAVTDPGTDTVSSYIVHWGDGNSDTLRHERRQEPHLRGRPRRPRDHGRPGRRGRHLPRPRQRALGARGQRRPDRPPDRRRPSRRGHDPHLHLHGHRSGRRHLHRQHAGLPGLRDRRQLRRGTPGDQPRRRQLRLHLPRWPDLDRRQDQGHRLRRRLRHGHRERGRRRCRQPRPGRHPDRPEPGRTRARPTPTATRRPTTALRRRSAATHRAATAARSRLRSSTRPPAPAASTAPTPTARARTTRA